MAYMQVFTCVNNRQVIYCLSSRFEHRELRPTNQPSEGTIKTDQVLTEVDRRSGKPRIRHGISLELFLDAKLPQARPIRAERCEVDTLSGT